MTPPSDPAADRAFYEELSRRRLPERTVRAIRYRNLIVARHVAGAGERVLEIGPGEGWLTRLLAEGGHRVVTADLARGWLDRIDAPGVCASMNRLPFAEGTFDAVVAAEVVEHVPDYEGALAEAVRVLRPGGRLVVTVPYRETLREERDPDTGALRPVNGHLHSFDEDTLDGAFRRAGVQPEEGFVGPTRFSREIIYRAPLVPLLPLLRFLDRATYRTQRVGDTWMLLAGTRP